MDMLITLVIEFSQLVGRRITRIIHLVDINKEMEIAIGLIFTLASLWTIAFLLFYLLPDASP